ncbi:MAG: metalloregulator ArsR/SmtB family transcription factor [Pseudomonadota bacterium]
MDVLETAATRLEALGNPTRLAIYRLLVRAGDDGRAVGQINAEIDLAASTLSHHLKHLEMAGLIKRRKEGVTHYCTANYTAMDDLIQYLTEECCADVALHPGRPHGTPPT